MQAVKQQGCQRAGNRKKDSAQRITKIAKKVEKLLKNLLTNERECDIMCLTSALRGVRENGFEKSRKKRKKVLKNPLTNSDGCDIIAGLCKTRH